MLYHIKVEEILEKTIPVTANSLTDAIAIVQDRYKNEEIVLTASDFTQVTIS